jgi:uncharacterized protein with von Willebrand factor type A (vWA) domain
MRRALASGGVPVEILRRRARPGRVDLVAMVDLSWSTSCAAETLLALLAPARPLFRRVRLHAFVADLVEISFENGHVVPHAPLDLAARSDTGRALAQLRARDAVLSRDTVLLVLGDARNNRFPPRADELARVRRAVRAVVWVNPEPRPRWDTGDSDMAAYRPHVDLLLEAPDLATLEAALARVAWRAA